MAHDVQRYYKVPQSENTVQQTSPNETGLSLNEQHRMKLAFTYRLFRFFYAIP